MSATLLLVTCSAEGNVNDTPQVFNAVSSSASKISLRLPVTLPISTRRTLNLPAKLLDASLTLGFVRNSLRSERSATAEITDIK